MRFKLEKIWYNTPAWVWALVAVICYLIASTMDYNDAAMVAR